MLSLIETKTNEKIRKKFEALTKQKDQLLESSNFPRIKPTDVSELRALVGLLYYQGFYAMKQKVLTFYFLKFYFLNSYILK